MLEIVTRFFPGSARRRDERFLDVLGLVLTDGVSAQIVEIPFDQDLVLVLIRPDELDLNGSSRRKAATQCSFSC